MRLRQKSGNSSQQVPKKSYRSQLTATGHRRPPGYRLYVVIEEELVRMRPQFNGVDLLFGFVLHPHVDGILGEHVALEQKFVVALQGIEGLFQRAGC